MKDFVKTSVSLKRETLPKAKKRARQLQQDLSVPYSFSAYIQGLVDRDLEKAKAA